MNHNFNDPWPIIYKFYAHCPFTIEWPSSAPQKCSSRKALNNIFIAANCLMFRKIQIIQWEEKCSTSWVIVRCEMMNLHFYSTQNEPKNFSLPKHAWGLSTWKKFVQLNVKGITHVLLNHRVLIWSSWQFHLCVFCKRC